jgi:hypothetical protein
MRHCIQSNQIIHYPVLMITNVPRLDGRFCGLGYCFYLNIAVPAQLL